MYKGLNKTLLSIYSMSNDIEYIDIILHELDILVLHIYNIAKYKSKTTDNYREIETKLYKRFFSKIDPITLAVTLDRLVQILDVINQKIMSLDMLYPELFEEDIKQLKVLRYILEHKLT
jgi:hypothetical protein